jgi:hypothetical protein
MKTLLLRLSMVAALALAVTALGTTALAQVPASQDPAATAPPQQKTPETQNPSPTPSAVPDQTTPPDSAPDAANPQQNEPQMPASGSEAQTQDPQAFTGKIVKQNGRVVLMDPATKTTYRIDDASKVRVYMGKEVKVTGRLDMNSNTIHVTGIETVSTD